MRRSVKSNFFRGVQPGRQYIRQLLQTVIPFTGVVNAQEGTAELNAAVLAKLNGHGDPGALTLRRVHEHCAAMHGGDGSHQYHAQTDALGAVGHSGGAQIAGVDIS